MKKLFLISSLLMAGQGCFAQAGSLTLENASPCSVYVNVIAKEITWLFTPCSIVSCTIDLPAGGSTSFASPNDFLVFLSSSCGAPPAIPPAYWTTLTDWYYTDVSFQYNCPSPMPNGGGYMSEAGTASCGSASVTWASTPHLANWYSTLTGTGLPMSNIKVVFN